MDRFASGVAWRLRRTSTNEVLAEHQPAHLETRVLPGSVAKVVTTLAALEQGQGDLLVHCPLRLTRHGRALDCVHAPRAAPFTLVEALAHSCNTYFAQLGDRLDVAAWQRLATRLGVPASEGDVPPDLVALGLEGPTASSTVWQRVVARARTDVSIPVEHRRLLDAGLRLAVREGTAVDVADAWTQTLAKTGTVVARGASEGLAIVLRPEDDLDLVVRVRGGAGRDAARVAKEVFEGRKEEGTKEEGTKEEGTKEEGRSVRVGTQGDDVATVTDEPIERYVALVVSAEAMPDMPPVVLDALAIAARTFAVAHRGRHAAEGFDLCDSTHCQVAASRVWPEARRAVERTRDMVLGDGGRVVPVFYSAACAGRLHAAGDVWPGQTAARSVVGDEPHPHPVPTWDAEVTATALADALRAAGLSGDLVRDLHVDGARDGMPRAVHIDGFTPRTLTADAFRTLVGRAIGWHVLKSHTWRVTRTAAGLRFDGRGKGHGVGLCVAGAVAYAQQQGAAGRVEPLLAAYYPALRLRSLADTVRLRVPLASQDDAPQLLGEVYAMLADLRQRLAFGAARTITIVEHPTTEAYQRATGRAWWTGGSTRVERPTAAHIDLPPLAGLARTGRVASVLRHELVHALTAATLADAPLWVREGVAVHFADTAASAAPQGPAVPGRPDGASAPRGGCPADADLAAPGGAEAMRRAYAAAGRCVADALAAGQRWRELAP